MNLAYAELYLMFDGIFSNYGSAQCILDGDNEVLELFDTTTRDVVPVADIQTFRIPAVWKGSKVSEFKSMVQAPEL
jgi:hypothetical protein